MVHYLKQSDTVIWDSSVFTKISEHYGTKESPFKARQTRKYETVRCLFLNVNDFKYYCIMVWEQLKHNMKQKNESVRYKPAEDYVFWVDSLEHMNRSSKLMYEDIWTRLLGSGLTVVSEQSGTDGWLSRYRRTSKYERVTERDVAISGGRVY